MLIFFIKNCLTHIILFNLNEVIYKFTQIHIHIAGLQQLVGRADIHVVWR
jgi:hypothetical protein